MVRLALTTEAHCRNRTYKDEYQDKPKTRPAIVYLREIAEAWLFGKQNKWMGSLFYGASEVL